MFEIYQNKKVFITGNTGFKGSWLAAFFNQLNVQVEGYALAPATTPAHFNLLQQDYKATIANILDEQKLGAAINEAKPDIVFHLAAQALVGPSYTDPVNTYNTNVMGTLNILEAARYCSSVKAVVLVTTDKVYENKETEKPYSEDDELGGYDMYSSSKACCEILIRSYRNSFLNIREYKHKHHILIASARAGNVIGGGDWSPDRLIPDIAAATAMNKKVQIRNPHAVRPWQHVLDCLYGYVLLGAKLLHEDTAFAGAWNFSPHHAEVITAGEMAEMAKQSWAGVDIEFDVSPGSFHEAGLLVLNNTKAVTQLGWRPVWTTAEAVHKTIDWYKQFYESGQVITATQIKEYLKKITVS